MRERTREGGYEKKVKQKTYNKLRNNAAQLLTDHSSGSCMRADGRPDRVPKMHQVGILILKAVKMRQTVFSLHEGLAPGLVVLKCNES